MKFYKTLGMVWTGVALAFASAPAVADDMDVLGQFLEQNFPVQNDPMEAFALSHAGQVEAQAALAGPLLSSQSALIFNNKTGEVLYQKNLIVLCRLPLFQIDERDGGVGCASGYERAYHDY